jgi:hypothetical protein
MSAVNVLGCGITIVGCTFYGWIRQQIADEAKAIKTKSGTPGLNNI